MCEYDRSVVSQQNIIPEKATYRPVRDRTNYHQARFPSPVTDKRHATYAFFVLYHSSQDVLASSGLMLYVTLPGVLADQHIHLLAPGSDLISIVANFVRLILTRRKSGRLWLVLHRTLSILMS